jgi:hypothetical protein
MLALLLESALRAFALPNSRGPPNKALPLLEDGTALGSSPKGQARHDFRRHHRYRQASGGKASSRSNSPSSIGGVRSAA